MAPHIEPFHELSGTRGLWTHTATIDWCESNYQVSYYVAEFWNTLSNLAFILPQLYHFISLRNHKSVESTYRWSFLGISLVGIGSLFFHMTLTRSMQMFDETSMILVTLHGFYLLYIIKRPTVNKKLLIAFLTLYCLIFFGFYIFLVNWPVFHNSCFAMIVYASMYHVYQLRNRYKQVYSFWPVFILQHAGFAFWLIDKHFCDILTTFRDYYVPPIFKPFFQFHALWHIFMGLSTHKSICHLIKLRAWIRYKESYVIRYKWLGLLLVLEKEADEQKLDTTRLQTDPKPLDFEREQVTENRKRVQMADKEIKSTGFDLSQNNQIVQ